jgi:hypothetical protein
MAKRCRGDAGSVGPLPGPELDGVSSLEGGVQGPAASSLAPDGRRRRGRPALQASARRTYRLNVSLPSEALEQLCARALRAGEKPSTYAGRVVLERLAAFRPLSPASEAVRAELRAAAEQLNQVMHELHLLGLQAPMLELDPKDAQRLQQALQDLKAALTAARAGGQP